MEFAIIFAIIALAFVLDRRMDAIDEKLNAKSDWDE